MSIRKSLAWSYASQAVTFVVGFTTSVIVARLLTPYDLGIYALATALVAVLGIVMSFSVHAYIVREAEVTRPMLRSVFTVNAVLNLTLAATLFVASVVEAGDAGQPGVAAVLRLTSLAPILAIFEFVPTALCMREMRYGVISVMNVVRVIVSSGVVVVSAMLGMGAISLAVGPLAAGLVCATAYTALRWRDTVFRPSFDEFRPVVAFGAQMVSISGVAQLAIRGSDLILGRLLGLRALGLYVRASGVTALLFNNVYGAATGVIFSQMSRELRDKGTLHDIFLRAIQMITGVMWPMVIGLAILSRPVVLILYGARWLGAAAPLSLLMLSTFVALGFGMNWELFVLRKETARQTRFELIRAAIGTAAFTIGCLFGITAAAGSRILEAVIGYMLYRPHMDRLAGTRPGELERIYLQALSLTAVAVAPSLALMIAYDWSPRTPPWAIGVAVLLGVAGWVALLIRQRHPLVGEAAIVLRRLRERRSA